MRTPTRLLQLLLGSALGLGSLPIPSAHAETLRASAEDTRALREAVRQGRLVPLESILADALTRVPGRVVDIEFEPGDDEYEIEILDATGQVWELEYRASTGAFEAMEKD